MRFEVKHMQCFMKKRILFIIAIFFTVSCIILLQTEIGSNIYFISWQTFENVSCYSMLSDNLPLINKNFTPPAKSIYFHETSCTGSLNSRQACSVESAARMHPNWKIYVLFAGPVAKTYLDEESFKVLRTYENVQLFRLYLREYSKDTPLESMVMDGALGKSRWRISHTSDALRYLTLYKWGGVYLDLDVIVAKSFEDLASNWGARESETIVAAGAIAFSRDSMGRIMAKTAIRDFKNNFRGDLWGHNGPGVMTRITKRICKTNKISEISTSSCKGFEVYPPELFYPLTWKNATSYFELNELSVGEPYTYHIWNKVTANCEVDKQSAYAKLAQEYCPKIYEAYGNKFGL